MPGSGVVHCSRHNAGHYPGSKACAQADETALILRRQRDRLLETLADIERDGETLGGRWCALKATGARVGSGR
jgi:hypothetical protein